MSQTSSNSQQVVVSGGNVIVVCRFRPLNKREKEMGSKACTEFHADKKGVTINMSPVSSWALSNVSRKMREPLLLTNSTLIESSTWSHAKRKSTT